MRNMENATNDQATQNGWKILVPFPGELIGKAIYKDANVQIMKSTKRLKVPGGYLYNVTTELYCGKDPAIAEALAFVPDVEAEQAKVADPPPPPVEPE